MKKVLGLIGAGLIAGAVIYVIWDITKKTKDEGVTTSKKDCVDASLDNSVSIMNKDDIHNDDFDSAKSLSISTISDRHEEASKIIKDAVENIYKRSEIPDDENCNLKQISDELDELLGEEKRWTN